MQNVEGVLIYSHSMGSQVGFIGVYAYEHKLLYTDKVASAVLVQLKLDN
jgi:hypothetical protein